MTKTPSRKVYRRRGSVYVLIIGVSMLAATITIAATLAARSQARAIEGSNNAGEARAYAQAAVDMGRAYIAANSNWRTARANGNWFTGTAIGSGSMSLDVTNPAGTLNRFNADPVILTGTGTCGASIQTVQATLTPTIKPYSCLATAMMGGGSLILNGSDVYPAGALVSTNSWVKVDAGTDVYSNIEAAGTFNVGGSFYGTKTSGTAPRTLPGATAFDYYTANGTTISFSAIGGKLKNGVLTSAANSITGAVNPNGIYIINCGGLDLDIQNCRLCATIVVLNCHFLDIKGSIRWLPAVSTLPALMAQASTVHIKPDSSNLNELDILVNLNPAGAPYPWPTGTTNATFLDSYGATLRGLMYVNGDVKFEDSTTLGMLIASGKIDCTGETVSCTYDATYLQNPPPGFYDVDMTTTSSSYTQVTY